MVLSLKNIFYGVLIFFLAGSFLTYDPTDNSLNTVIEGYTNNIMGAWGAWISDLFIQLLGMTSFSIPFFLLWKLYTHTKQRKIYHKKLKTFSYFIGFIPLSCLLLRLIDLLVIGEDAATPTDLFQSGWGGFLGYHFFEMAEQLYPEIRDLSWLLMTITVVLTLLNLKILNFIFGIPLLPLLRLIGTSIHTSYSLIKYMISRVYNKIKIIQRKRRVIHTPAPQHTFESKEGHLDSLSNNNDMTSSSEKTAPAPIDEDVEELPLWQGFKEQKNRKVQAKTETKKTMEYVASSIRMLPSLDLLTPSTQADRISFSTEELEQKSQKLQSVLEEYGVQGRIVGYHPGPVVTLFDFEPAPGTKSARIISLSDDIARSMSTISARIAVIPNQNALGIELPNEKREKVVLRELLADNSYERSEMQIALCLGKDIGGTSVLADLAKMPHLLVAGTTGSGKSVGINAMILSIIYKMPPHQCRFIMIDPKMLELSIYNGIPHLLSPVVTDPKKAVVALKWAIAEMENRYKAMSEMRVRNIQGYNERIHQAINEGELLSRKVQTGFDPESGKPIFENISIELKPFPYLVIIVDEMADLMLVAGKDIELLVQRLAQMARAAGIHLIMATQRPSVDVITGTIKANFPTRMSFQVPSKFDSKTILGENGAEQLLGQGDMLYQTAGGKKIRVHGPFVSDQEVEQVVAFLKSIGEPEYEDIFNVPEDETSKGKGSKQNSDYSNDSGDELYDRALQIVLEDRKASTSYIQRRLQIGYNRAARLVEQMEEEGILSPPNHVGKREILMGKNQAS